MVRTGAWMISCRGLSCDFCAVVSLGTSTAWEEPTTNFVSSGQSAYTHLTHITNLIHTKYSMCSLYDFTLWATPYVCLAMVDVAGTPETWETPTKGFLFIMFSSSPARVSMYHQNGPNLLAQNKCYVSRTWKMEHSRCLYKIFGAATTGMWPLVV